MLPVRLTDLVLLYLLSSGKNVVTIEVTQDSGRDTKIYKLNIFRKHGKSMIENRYA